MTKSVVFIDTEVSVDNKIIHDIGAVRGGPDLVSCCFCPRFQRVYIGYRFSLRTYRDLKFIQAALDEPVNIKAIDTLYSLLFYDIKEVYNRFIVTKIS